MIDEVQMGARALPSAATVATAGGGSADEEQVSRVTMLSRVPPLTAVLPPEGAPPRPAPRPPPFPAGMQVNSDWKTHRERGRKKRKKRTAML